MLKTVLGVIVLCSYIIHKKEQLKERRSKKNDYDYESND